MSSLTSVCTLDIVPRDRRIVQTRYTRDSHGPYTQHTLQYTSHTPPSDARRARGGQGLLQEKEWLACLKSYLQQNDANGTIYIYTYNRRHTTHHRFLPPSNLMLGKREAGKGLHSSGRQGTATRNCCPLLDTIHQRT